MLVKLKIKNIALISESVIEFNSGLNILTGETGAGKSLIIDSLNFVLGARADKTLIKNGEDYASVEAVFMLDQLSDEILDFFNLINSEPETTIIISRYLNLSGKSEIKVNGEFVTNSMLKKLTVNLVDIHGQHAHQSLLEVKNHLSILDSFNTLEINTQKNILKAKLNNLKEINVNIQSIGGDGKDRERNIELLEFQLREIELTNLKEGEEEELLSKKTIMLNSEKIYNALSQGLNLLSVSEQNALTFIKSAINNLSNITRFDNELQLSHEKLENLYYELLDVNELLSEKSDQLDFSEDELNNIEERLDVIKALKRKYGSTIAEILTYYNETSKKLEQLINSDKELAKLNADKKNLLNDIYNTCNTLTEIRKNTANQISNQIILQLKDLGMKSASFTVVFNNTYTSDNIESLVTQQGADVVEFMFSANLGEPVKPLSKIISGGEMSRFMLAIKCVINENNNKTFIFDEIDNGIGGVAGLIVAEKLSQISKSNQVLCVTHLAQIAAYANNHYKIAKVEESGRTKTVITLLQNEDIVSEVSRMLGSSNNSNVGLLHAQELLKNASDYKNKL